MMRDIVRIDSEKCTGCGACAETCSEGAIRMVDGKAVLVSELHCDGLGAGLPSCPAGAISIARREAAPFVDLAMPGRAPQRPCPGSIPRDVRDGDDPGSFGRAPSRLSHWPVKIRLAPVTAPFLDGCDLLLAADCSAFACGSFHEDFIRGRRVLTGCPKLDPPECWERLYEIVSRNNVRSIKVVRMEVPCCSPIYKHAEEAVRRSGKPIGIDITVLGTDGSAKERQRPPGAVLMNIGVRRQ